MSSTPLFLRIKSQAGQHKINGLTQQATVGCLLEKIEEINPNPMPSSEAFMWISSKACRYIQL